MVSIFITAIVVDSQMGVFGEVDELSGDYQGIYIKVEVPPSRLPSFNPSAICNSINYIT